MDISIKLTFIFILLISKPISAEDIVIPDHVNDIPFLEIEEGYLILDLDIDSPVSEITLRRKIEKYSYYGYKKAIVRIVNINQGANLTIIKLSAGTYRWEDIKVPFYNLPYVHDLSKKNLWQFKIFPNRLNYVSKITVKEKRSTTSVDITRLNRIAESLPNINQQFKNLLKKYPLIYSGFEPDDFLALLNTKKNSHE